MRPVASLPAATDKEVESMAVITVSRTYGLFMEEILQKFAERNKLDIFSHQLLMEVAKSVQQPLDKIEDLYRKGNVIIIGRGSQIILRNYPDVIHLRFDASPEYRIRQVMKKEKISAEEAEEKVKKIDRKRRDYISYFYGKKVDSPDLYDMIINVERLRGKALGKVLQSLV